VGGKNPFPITVTPADPNGAHSRAHGPGLNQSNLKMTQISSQLKHVMNLTIPFLSEDPKWGGL